MDKFRIRNISFISFFIINVLLSFGFLTTSTTKSSDMERENFLEDGRFYRTKGNISPRMKAINPDPSVGNGVLLQGFYWLNPEGDWWNTIKQYIPDFADIGVDAIWLPPPSKAAGTSGVSGMGYEPYDYYDLGEYNQKNQLRTLYGTRSDLEALIDTLHAQNLYVIGDIVMNHCNGGDMEFNPIMNENTPTNFENVASGNFYRNYTHFHTANLGGDPMDSDNYAFGAFPDFDHTVPYVHDELIKWGDWLKSEIGYDGWRFDVALGIIPDMIRDWMQSLGGYGIAEYWSGSEMTTSEQISYLNQGNNTFSSFDFILMYALREMCIPSADFDMNMLSTTGLLNHRSDQAVTFITNHDTYRQVDSRIPEEYRMMGYAYILTNEGYPMIYWDDYYNLSKHHELNAMIQIHNEYAYGSLEIINTGNDHLVMQRTGEPGIMLIINENPLESVYVEIPGSKWENDELVDLLGRHPTIQTNSSGGFKHTIPPYSYAIYSNRPQLYSPPSAISSEIPTLFEETILIDGRLDYTWNRPIVVDTMGDAQDKPIDLNHLYLATDNEFLYIAFNVGKYNLWQESNVQYGIAFDTTKGGVRTDPLNHAGIRWGGTKAPDHIYYLNTDIEESPFLIQNITGFEINSEEQWAVKNQTLEQNIDFKTNPAFALTEIRIPLNEIDLATGGNFSIKIFSTAQDKYGAMDSIPHDSEVDVSGETETWLTFTNQYTISEITNNTLTSTTEIDSRISGFSILILSGVEILAIIYIIGKRKSKLGVC